LTLTQGMVEHPDFDNAQLNYRAERLPESGDGQVAVTIRKMCQYVLEDCVSPLIAEDAAEAVREGNGDPVLGAFRLANKRIRFQQDSYTGRWGGPGVVEVLIRPVDICLFGKQHIVVPGDCDDFSMYVACLLIANGVPCSFVTVAADDRDPSAYSHVYVAAYPDGKRKAVDASHGKFAGWEVANKFGKCREWPVEAASVGAFGGGMDWGTLLLIAAVAGGAWWYFTHKDQFSIGSIVKSLWGDE